jgi:hypothetical protein
MRIGRTLGCPDRSHLCGRCSQRSSSSRLASSESVTLTTVNGGRGSNEPERTNPRSIEQAWKDWQLQDERNLFDLSRRGSFPAAFLFFSLATWPPHHSRPSKKPPKPTICKGRRFLA